MITNIIIMIIIIIIIIIMIIIIMIIIIMIVMIIMIIMIPTPLPGKMPHLATANPQAKKVVVKGGGLASDRS